MSESTLKGAIAEAAITAAAVELGIYVLRPMVEEPAINHQEAAITYAADHELGAIAQLGERRHGMAEVVGSSPTSSTPSRPS